MLPDVYGNVDAIPVLQTLLHLTFIAVEDLGGYASERYSPRAGLTWTIAMVMMGVICATGFGSPAPLA